MTEDEILDEIIKLRRGEESNYNGLDLEAELGRLYMPRLDPSASVEEMMAWGAEYRRIVMGKIAAKEGNQS